MVRTKQFLHAGLLCAAWFVAWPAATLTAADQWIEVKSQNLL